MSAQTEHDNRVLGGMKATLHNPNTSAEAKEHAAQVLTEHGVELSDEDKAAGHVKPHHDHETRAKTHQSESEEKEKSGAEHEHRVIGGYKSTLANPNTSEEAKEHARQKLEEAGL